MKMPAHVDLVTASAFELAASIRAGERTSVEVVEAHIAHMVDVNPTLNAVVRDRFDLAREEARAADERIGACSDPDSLPPLCGVPCTIKECFAFEGMPQSAGLVARKDVLADQDATAVARLRAAGAIPMGVTNLSELCMWLESSNRVYGRTNNPYDPGRIVGGSSGGEGAIVASGASPFGLGSDIGGSIRLPAFFNGVFGHKATGGLVPSTGQYPDAENDAKRMLCTGPITRRAADLMPLLRILAGPDGIDPSVEERELGDPGAVNLEGLDVVSVADFGGRRVSRSLRTAQGRCEDALAARGARVRHERIPGLKRSQDIWAHRMAAADDTSFRKRLGEGAPVHLAKQFALWALRRSPHTLPALALSWLEKLPLVVPKDLEPSLVEGRRLRDEIVERIGQNGVMLYPTYTRVAPRHMMPMLTPMDWVYTAIFNALELPVTQVPLGLDGQGLPLGVQVAGIHGNDHVTIAVALALEESLGGWVPPWTVRT